MDHFKKLAEMREIVKSELEHIPRGNFDQNMLRGFFWAGRMNGLKQGKTKEETLEKCIEFVKKDNPNFKPRYDKDFFNFNEK